MQGFALKSLTKIEMGKRAGVGGDGSEVRPSPGCGDASAGVLRISLTKRCASCIDMNRQCKGRQIDGI